MKTTLTGILLAAALVWGSGCNKKQLKKPASTGGGESSQANALKEEDVRQIARVFAQEFAAELKRQNVSLASTGSATNSEARPFTKNCPNNDIEKAPTKISSDQ